eukprot:SRR837773.26414.p1 GENE.SRR837773.26414~~SRR837773.26414.p1  ORF type:complete len:143 (-),score=28.11 SRR837773.26414:41-424(-)
MVCQWSLSRNELVRRLEDAEDGKHELGVTCLLLRGELLLSGSADGTVRLWHKESGRSLGVYGGGYSGVLCLCATRRGPIYSGQARGYPDILRIEEPAAPPPEPSERSPLVPALGPRAAPPDTGDDFF